MITHCETCSNWHEEDQHNPHIVPKERDVIDDLIAANLTNPDPDNEGTD